MAKKRKKKRSNRKKKQQFPVGLLIALVVLLGLLGAFALLRKPPDATPQPLTFQSGDFLWEDGRMHCTSRTSIPGIDVSYYQGHIDWEQVKASGIEFVFVRLGYRSSADGTLKQDQYAYQNLRGAAEVGLKVGAYFFSQALTPSEAVEEANFALSMLDDQALQMPLVFDWEEVSSRTAGMTRQNLTDCVKAFCDTVEDAGYEPMVYYNRDVADRLLDLDNLTQYPVWFAMYNTDYPNAPGDIRCWQYTDRGSVPGIPGDVDLDLWFP